MPNGYTVLAGICPHCMATDAPVIDLQPDRRIHIKQDHENAMVCYEVGPHMLGDGTPCPGRGTQPLRVTNGEDHSEGFARDDRPKVEWEGL